MVKVDIQELIKAALDKGAATPRSVLNYITSHSNIDPPSIPTIISIMKNEFGYQPAEEWKKGEQR